MKKLDVLFAVLLVIGGLNWGLVGTAQLNPVAFLFGDNSAVSRLVYVVVGIAAVYQALQWRSIQQRWLLAPARSARS